MKSATVQMTATLGALMGIAGIEHGIGEILQGSTTPAGVMILSWPSAPFFRSVGGEPALTILPSLQITGILAVLFSMAYLAWATLWVRRKHTGVVMMLLAIAMLLFGGGIFPPVIGFFTGILATRIHAPLACWQVHLSPGVRHFHQAIWPWVYAACLLAWLCLFPGISLLGYFSGVNDPGLTIAIILCAVGTLLAAIYSGFAYDSFKQLD